MEHSEDTDRAAVFAANAEFYRAFADGDFPAMTALWAEREPIVCIHPGWPPVSGRSDVLASWRGILADPPQPPVRPSDEQVYLMGEAALIDAVKAGRIAGAGLDVFDIEPLPADHPYRTLEGIVPTPHLGYTSAENYRCYFEEGIEDIDAWLKGAPVRVMTP
jgi:hypothetical protein